MKKRKVKPPQLIKLNLNEVKHDLTRFPFPYKPESVEELTALHKLEYIPGKLRIAFMEEIYRILAPEGKATFLVAYWSSPRSIQDSAYEWPPWSENSFLYFNARWREINGLPKINCDFDFTYGYQVDPETASRNPETQAFQIKHYNQSVMDLTVTMTKRPTHAGVLLK